jgi:hypothetical protein
MNWLVQMNKGVMMQVYPFTNGRLTLRHYMEKVNRWKVVLKNTVCFAAATLPLGKLLPLQTCSQAQRVLRHALP